MGVEAARLAAAVGARRRRPTPCGSPRPPRPTSTRPTPPPSTPPCDCPPRSRPSTSAAPCVRGPGPWPAALPGRARRSSSGRPARRAARWRRRVGRRGRRRRCRGRRRRPRRSGRGRATWRAPRPPTRSSTAGGPRASGAPRSGRSASARPATSPSGATPGTRALKAAGVGRGRGRPRRGDRACTPGPSGARRSPGARRAAPCADDLSGTVGQTGTAHPALVLASVLEEARPPRRARAHPGPRPPGRRRRRARLPHDRRPGRLVPGPSGGRRRWRAGRSCPTASSCRGGACSPRSRLGGPSPSGSPSPPPGAARSGSSASWARRDRSSGAVHLPPARVSMAGGAVDDMEPLAHGRRPGHRGHLHRRPPGLLARARPSSSPWWTSTAVVASRSS